MKIIKTFFLLLLSLTFVQALRSQELDYQKIGTNIAESIACIQPGEVVIVLGGEHTIRMMEAIVIAAQKKGGIVSMVLSTEDQFRSYYQDSPLEYLGQNPWTKWYGDIDVWIFLSHIKDESGWQSNLSEERLNILQQEDMKDWAAVEQSKLRIVYFPYPTEKEANNTGLDYETYLVEYLNGATADFDQLAARATKMESMLLEAKEVHITTPAGTDFTFQSTGRPCSIYDGKTTAADSLAPMMQRFEMVPSGLIVQTIIETSAKGKVVIPELLCDGTPQVENLSFELSDGMIQSISGKGAACIEKGFTDLPKEARQLSMFSIGLNPAIRTLEEGDINFRPKIAGGKVSLNFGNNLQQGGQNASEGSFPTDFPLTNATVTIDGVVVVKDGVLQELE